MMSSSWSLLVLAVSYFGINCTYAFSPSPTFRRGGVQNFRADGSTMEAHTLNALDEDEEASSAVPLEKDGPKDRLLNMIRAANNMEYDSDISESGRSKISALSQDLKGYALPVRVPSQWTLLYNDAPDILGLKGGPLSQLVSIQQDYKSTSELSVVLEYKPSEGVTSLAGSFLNDIEQDRLKQTIAFEYSSQPMNKIDLKLTGTNIEGSRFGSLPMLSTPTSVPFVGFNILFNDDDLCIQQTVQGQFLFIYQRI